jgi:RNA polymerase sigma-70 factor (ECF subfamily)
MSSTPAGCIALVPARSWVEDAFLGALLDAIPVISAAALRITRNSSLAADLAQETYRRALEARHRFLPNSNMRGWLLRILSNCACDHFRHARLEIRPITAWDEIARPDPEEPLWWRSVSSDQLAHAVAQLPLSLREVHVLFWEAGLSYREISARLGVPSTTVGTRLNRARSRLRELLVAARAGVVALDPARRARARDRAKAPRPDGAPADASFDRAAASR